MATQTNPNQRCKDKNGKFISAKACKDKNCPNKANHPKSNTEKPQKSGCELGICKDTCHNSRCDNHFSVKQSVITTIAVVAIVLIILGVFGL